MSQNVSIIISILFFLVSLFLFKAIFLALGIALAFLLLTTLLEIAWEYRETLIVLTSINLVISATLALALYALIYLPVEFLITEILFLTPEIFPLVGLIFLGVLVFGLSLLNFKDILLSGKWRRFVVSLLVISSLVYGFWRHYKLAREYLPKIYKISPNWAIQGQIIKIEGLNFGPPFRKGMVIVGNKQGMIIKSWEDKLVVVEQPVPDKFMYDRLRIIRSDNVSSNEVPFEIKDPGNLGKYEEVF